MHTGLGLIGRARFGGLLAGALLAVGCHEHVALRVPSASSSPESRTSSYEQLRPLSMHETHITYLQGGVPVGAARVTDYMQLANGQRVYYPEDILSVVPEASASALAAESSASARSTATTLSGVAMAAYLVGGVVMLLPILNHDVSTPINTTPIYIGGGLVLSGLVMHLVGMGYRSSANDEAATAFETYDAGLRERLSLCGHDGALGSCR